MTRERVEREDDELILDAPAADRTMRSASPIRRQGSPIPPPQAMTEPPATSARGRARPSGGVIRRTLYERYDDEDPIPEERIAQLMAMFPAHADDIRAAAASGERFVVNTGTRSGFRLDRARERKRGAGGGGGMFGRLGGAAVESTGLQQLAFAAETVQIDDELSGSYGTEEIGDFGMPVKQRVPKRQGKHAATFKAETGFASANQAAAAAGAVMSSYAWEITHLKGYAQAGAQADRQADNLVAASRETNTEMMFFDAAVTGNTDVIVATTAEVYRGTKVAKSITMRFIHRSRPDHPFFERTIPGLRPEISREEAALMREQAHREITATLEAAAALVAFAGQPGAQ